MKNRNISKSGNRKNKQDKRQASSPLDDNGGNSDYSLTGLTVTTEKGEPKTEQNKVKPKKKCKQNCPDTESSKNSGYNFAAAFTNPYQTMSFTPQSTPYNMSQTRTFHMEPLRLGTKLHLFPLPTMGF